MKILYFSIIVTYNYFVFVFTNTNVIANNPKLTIQQFAKTKASTTLIAITSTVYSVRMITTSPTK